MVIPAGIPNPFEHGFSDDPVVSASLPSLFFTDPLLFEHEKKQIFFRSWLLAGQVNDIPEPGDYLTMSVFDQSVILIRGKDGAIKAFHNVCRHRGHELLEGKGRITRITCPYHAWSYGLEGTLVSAPNSEKVKCFDTKQYPLSPVAVEILAGLIFINLDSEISPLGELASGLDDEIRSLAPACDSLVLAHSQQDVMRCNWKVAVENWSECYHCHVVHKPLATEFIDFSTFRVELNPLYQRQRMKLRDGVAGTNAQAEQASWTLLPNLGIQIVEGGYIMTSLWRPIDADHCEFIENWYLPNAEPTPQQRELFRFRAEHTQPEDVAVCEGLQRGLHNLSFEQGRLMVDAQRSEMSEHGSHHIQLWVARTLMQD